MENNMVPSKVHMRVTRDELEELGRLTCRLSDLITMLVYHASLLPPSPSAPELERTMILTGLITKTETYMKELMWCLGHLDCTTRIRPALAEESKEINVGRTQHQRRSSGLSQE